MIQVNHRAQSLKLKSILSMVVADIVVGVAVWETALFKTKIVWTAAIGAALGLSIVVGTVAGATDVQSIKTSKYSPTLSTTTRKANKYSHFNCR